MSAEPRTGMEARPGSSAPTHGEMMRRILEARARLHGVAHRTPVVTSRTLDERVGARVFLKCENLQRMGAFKFRGAYNAIAQLSESARRRGVVAWSSGNHAQAVALVSRLLAVPATIVMPSTAPRAKLDATRGYGAEVVFYDQLGEEREQLAERLATERGLTPVPPFDHPNVVAGQGTAAFELLEEAGPLDLLVVPVGGGGLISGSALAARDRYPECRVIGVEPEAGDDGAQSLKTGRLVLKTCGPTIADGARTASLGTLTFPLIQRYVEEIVTASDAELIESMKFVWERLKLVVEPTGVLGLAALLTGRVSAPGRRIGVILSGGNADLVQSLEWFRQAPERTGTK